MNTSSPLDTEDANILCRRLEWDSAHFGYNIATVVANRLEGPLIDAVLRWCKVRAVRCLYFAGDPTCVHSLSLAHATGFKFVDFRLEFERDLPSSQYQLAPSPGIRTLGPGDIPAMEDLAARAHSDTRFFKDSQFNKTQAAELYKLWFHRAAREHRVWVAADPNDAQLPRGYVTLQGDVLDDSLSIGLLAIDESSRGQGIGRALIFRALFEAEALGAKRVRVVTQGSNVPAQRLYQATGFRTASARAWFHRWF